MDTLFQFGGMIIQGLMSVMSLFSPVVNFFKGIFGPIMSLFSPSSGNGGGSGDTSEGGPRPNEPSSSAMTQQGPGLGAGFVPMILSGLFGIASAPAAPPPKAPPKPKAKPEEAEDVLARDAPSTADKFNMTSSTKAGGTEINVGDGKTFVYIPKNFKPNKDGTYDVIYHFHGVPQRQRENIEESGVNAVVVSYNMEGLSGVYSKKFANRPQVFRSLEDRVQKAVEKSGRAPGARAGRLALSGWSAGFGAVGSILAYPGMEDRIDSIFIADGLHTAYKDGKPFRGSLEKWKRFAERAKSGDKTFVVTHSSIQTQGYANTTETAESLLDMTGVPRKPVSGWGPGNMQQTSQAEKGGFHVKGFKGTGKSDHIDHIMEMDSLHFSYLGDKWGTTSPTSRLETGSPSRGQKPKAAIEVRRT